jgi:hypothetical protein
LKKFVSLAVHWLEMPVIFSVLLIVAAGLMLDISRRFDDLASSCEAHAQLLAREKLDAQLVSLRASIMQSTSALAILITNDVPSEKDLVADLRDGLTQLTNIKGNYENVTSRYDKRIEATKAKCTLIENDRSTAHLLSVFATILLGIYGFWVGERRPQRKQRNKNA